MKCQWATSDLHVGFLMRSRSQTHCASFLFRSRLASASHKQALYIQTMSNTRFLHRDRRTTGVSAIQPVLWPVLGFCRSRRARKSSSMSPKKAGAWIESIICGCAAATVGCPWGLQFSRQHLWIPLYLQSADLKENWRRFLEKYLSTASSSGPLRHFECLLSFPQPLIPSGL